MTMLKKLICWLKTRHANRRYLGFFHRAIDLDCIKHYAKYQCKDCNYKGNKYLGGDYD